MRVLAAGPPGNPADTNTGEGTMPSISGLMVGFVILVLAAMPVARAGQDSHSGIT